MYSDSKTVCVNLLDLGAMNPSHSKMKMSIILQLKTKFFILIVCWASDFSNNIPVTQKLQNRQKKKKKQEEICVCWLVFNSI